MKNQNKIILENSLEITGTTLLTAEEAERLPKKTLAIGCWWWLRSPGNCSSSAADVSSGGSVCYGGTYVHGNNAVRPALIINPKSSNLTIGDRFRFGKKEFEIISDTRALCTESIGGCAFRADWQAEDTNDYEKSDVKKFVDEWYSGACEYEKTLKVFIRPDDMCEFIGQLMDIFEDFLEEKGITFPETPDLMREAGCSEEEIRENQVILYGDNYYKIADRIENMLNAWNAWNTNLSENTEKGEKK